MSITSNEFHGVYVLTSKNPRYAGHVYIGYTVNPSRRILQHNRGKQFGGAARTNARGPWEMILIVHGFPSATSALMFEWAMQHPYSSRHLKGFLSNRRNTNVTGCLDILWTLLSLPPFIRLPLTIRWISESHVTLANNFKILPLHMSIIYGKFTVKKGLGDNPQIEDCHCFLCQEKIDSAPLRCIHSLCLEPFHIVCLSKHFLVQEVGKTNQVIPIDGRCPKCQKLVLWGDIIQKLKGQLLEFDSETINTYSF